MNVFDLRNRLIDDYKSYVSSFVNIRDERIRDHVRESLDSGALWPDPLIQLNPSFEPGDWIDDLVKEGVLHEECGRVFRMKRDPHDEGQPLRLHKHQSDAVRVARGSGGSDGGGGSDSYVLTTGTGSGKSLAYIVPIVDHVLRRGSGKGIQAIVVYPMNALANSHYGELEKFLKFGYPDGRGPVTFARYTGQENDVDRQAIMANPPDIILTNYVMLELILTRPIERPLIEAAQGLRFLVLDELHTYRGRQGADVALLVRRVRDRLASANSASSTSSSYSTTSTPSAFQCVGTSATLAGAGSYDEQRAQVAAVATRIFGSEVRPENVIGETLRRATLERDLEDPSSVSELARRIEDPANRPPTGFQDFVNDPLSAWIESTFGVVTEPGTDRLIRSTPRSISGSEGAARQLSELTGAPVERCAQAIEEGLLAGYTCEPNPETGFPVFAFRLHQFLSRGDAVYTSLQPEDERYITVYGQKYRPGSRDHILLPVVFCRECGEEYFVVRRTNDQESGGYTYLPRQIGDQAEISASFPGFLHYSSDPDETWPADYDTMLERLPEDWVEEVNGVRRVTGARRKELPTLVQVAPDGREVGQGAQGGQSTDGRESGSGPGVAGYNENAREAPLRCHFVTAPFRFCLHCGVSYDFRQKDDFSKLALLSSEGRSTATTILSMSAIRELYKTDLPRQARKLLSFTDNRQDASLQAGHFNDFVEIGLLRSALYRAVRDAGEGGLDHAALTQKVFSALALPLDLYASDPDVKFQLLKETERALREVLGYRLYRDLKRGWRITSPNLEQCGLLRIEYLSLDELCAAEGEWADKHAALATASPETRMKIARVLLDYMRRELAIKVDYLDQDYQERIQQLSSQRLVDPWAIDENERMEHSSVLYPRPTRHGDFQGDVYLSARGGFGQYLRRRTTFGGSSSGPDRLTLADTQQVINDLLEGLRVAGLVEVVRDAKSDKGSKNSKNSKDSESGKNGGDVPGYQVPTSAMLWTAGDGTRAFHDPIRVPSAAVSGAHGGRGDRAQRGGRTNRFFVDFYKAAASDLPGMRAREHTAQVPYELREEREDQFRKGDLPILYCSPTMELGVDISELNVVNMRNVPPTPANYAQRSGRAGRSGQPALVFSYCTTGSPHDQYFFKRPENMVAGAVTPPRLDLANEDLVRSHVHAVWLAETRQSLGKSLKDLVDVSGEQPTLELQPEVQETIGSHQFRERARVRAERVLASLGDELTGADWYTEGWLDNVLAQVARQFDLTCERWRGLYRAALKQMDVQTRVIRDASRSAEDKNQAKRLRREAESQLDLLTEVANVVQSDFYSYRYFASEGFLPGYSFPRLPISAFIPARRIKQQDEFLSRPRFLAISEFGPRAIVYHEGSRYLINKVILPVGESHGEGSGAGGGAGIGGDEGATVTMLEVKRCIRCGYLHPVLDGVGQDLCQFCGAALGEPLRRLFRLQNVSTKRRDRISSDEEERQRMGYELISGVRFGEHDGHPSFRIASAFSDGHDKAAPGDGDDLRMPLVRLTYGHTATIWRINLGWTRRRDKSLPGFLLDLERGYWARNDDLEEEDQSDPMSPSKARVIPYVEDRRNCMLLEPTGDVDAPLMASLQAATKSAIQVLYQLEDGELATEPLPSADDRRLILLYESSEGGAGVLRRLVDDRRAFAEVARKALELCHFDPNTGEDLHRAPRAREDCEAACYDCLMSYSNQRDHRLLDRHAIRDLLLQWTRVEVESAPGGKSKAEHIEELMRTAGSELEKKWVRYLDERNLRLPTKGQLLIEACGTRPDFFYNEEQVAIYIDGPVHDYPHRQERDRTQSARMLSKGYMVIRFGHDEDWDVVLAKHPDVFGKR
ncbi:MAG: DEAD/DEAH box helicase [Thermaceae bacterium]|nr:DEAD/DEAH box helicase [Thermaceae bacterium]